jgi:predicted DNA-binding helix-hairpin-helix protein
MKKLVLFCALIAGLTNLSLAEDKNADIIAATKTYVAANSGMTKITATVEQIADDFARVKVTPEDAKAADPAWVFLKKQDGKWTGLTLGTSFTTEDYQQLGIPNALRVP